MKKRGFGARSVSQGRQGVKVGAVGISLGQTLESLGAEAEFWSRVSRFCLPLRHPGLGTGSLGDRVGVVCLLSSACHGHQEWARNLASGTTAFQVRVPGFKS